MDVHTDKGGPHFHYGNQHHICMPEGGETKFMTRMMNQKTYINNLMKQEERKGKGRDRRKERVGRSSGEWGGKGIIS